MSAISERTIQALPKVELHLHLDGSARPQTVTELGAQLDIRLPDDVNEALVCPPACQDLAEFLTRLDLALEVLQTASALERVAYELVEDLAEENVIYAEVRYAPQLCGLRGLSMQQVVDAVTAGLLAGRKEFGVPTGQIICCLRHESPQSSLEVARMAIANWRPDKVVGLDLAADEASHAGLPHQSTFRLAQEAGIPRTVHAGEAAGAESIREAITLLGAQRLGHGVRLEEDPGLFEPVRTRQIALEMCPTSNVLTRAVRSLADHPIDRYLGQNLPVTVNTDSRTTCDTTLTQEYHKLVRQFGWGLEEIKRTVLTAANCAFLPDDQKAELRSAIHRRWPAK